MKDDAFSIIIQYWRATEQRSERLEVMRVDTDTAQALPLLDFSFLLRFSKDESIPVERCLLRHLPSGREIYLQSGSDLQAFIKACLVDGSTGASPEGAGE